MFFNGQHRSNILLNLFHALLNSPIKKTDRPKKFKTLKDGGGGSRVGMTAVKDSTFFLGFPNTNIICMYPMKTCFQVLMPFIIFLISFLDVYNTNLVP